MMARISVAVLLLTCACGQAPRPDGGTGGGGGFGGFGGFGGNTGGGSGGGSAGGGTGGATATLTFTIIEGRGTPVTDAGVRLSGPNLISTGITDAQGRVSVSFPASERPFDLTVAAVGHEALSIIGVTTEVPATLRIDPTTFSAQVQPISGNITGKTPASTMQIDMYDGLTVFEPSSVWQSQYMTDSTVPLTVVGIELSPTKQPMNYATFTGTRGGQVVANLALPSPVANLRTTTHQLLPAATGMLNAAALGAVTQYGGALGHYVFTNGASYVLSGATTLAGGASPTLRLWGVPDAALLPNRLAFWAAIPNPPMRINRWVTDPYTGSTTSALPEVTQLALQGTSLANVGATGAGVGFDTLALQISTAQPNLNTTYWRCYTAPGAPLQIAHLPNLPPGITPQSLGLADPIQAVPMLIHFASPTGRPWQLGGGDISDVSYEFTVAPQYVSITSAWR